MENQRAMPPPRARVSRIFEIDNGVDVAIEILGFKQLGGFMGHTGEGELRARIELRFRKTAEQSRRRRAIKAMIVIENSNLHVELGDQQE